VWTLEGDEEVVLAVWQCRPTVARANAILRRVKPGPVRLGTTPSIAGLSTIHERGEAVPSRLLCVQRVLAVLTRERREDTTGCHCG
jgi:hypothetical protein